MTGIEIIYYISFYSYFGYTLYSYIIEVITKEIAMFAEHNININSNIQLPVNLEGISNQINVPETYYEKGLSFEYISVIDNSDIVVNNILFHLLLLNLIIVIIIILVKVFTSDKKFFKLKR